ncbi:MAG: DUF47 family protein [Desulfurococcales archaeon]|nr:DUF47 family protein [Desulfurococcales archaeon]
MLSGTGNISIVTLLEQLIYIAEEASNALNRLVMIIPENGDFPEPEVVDKFLRQDVRIAKNKIDDTVEKILEYLASSRLELVDRKEFYINVALRYRDIMDYLSHTAHRLLLLSKRIQGNGTNAALNSKIRKMAATGNDILSRLTLSIRGLLSAETGTEEAVKQVESLLSKVKLLEQTADELYVDLLENIIDAYGDNLVAYTLYREVIDRLEDLVDASLSQATDILILAKSTIS